MKTHELILAIMLALALGVVIEVCGNIIFFLPFGRGIFVHFWSLLHRPIMKTVLLILPPSAGSGYGLIIFYRLLCVCAWAMLSFITIWAFHWFHRESGDKN